MDELKNKMFFLCIYLRYLFIKENKIKQLVAETKENMLENLDDIVRQSKFFLIFFLFVLASE